MGLPGRAAAPEGARGRSAEEIAAEAIRLGAAPADVPDLVQDLVRDGVLVAAGRV